MTVVVVMGGALHHIPPMDQFAEKKGGDPHDLIGYPADAVLVVVLRRCVL